MFGGIRVLFCLDAWPARFLASYVFFFFLLYLRLFWREFQSKHRKTCVVVATANVCLPPRTIVCVLHLSKCSDAKADIVFCMFKTYQRQILLESTYFFKMWQNPISILASLPTTIQIVVDRRRFGVGYCSSTIVTSVCPAWTATHYCFPRGSVCCRHNLVVTVYNGITKNLIYSCNRPFAVES